MAPGVITFISGRYTLVENENMACINLRDSWCHLFGEEPDLTPTGLAVVGMHVPTPRPWERAMKFRHAASPRAVSHAIGLIKLKYAVERVEIIGRVQLTLAANVWLPSLGTEPPDVSVLSVWPEEHEREVRDGIVLELADNPGKFVHRMRQERGAFWLPPADRVGDALVLPCTEIAAAWARACGGEDGPLIPRWRSAVLAEEDQVAAMQFEQR